MDDLALEAVLAKIYPDPGSLNRVLMGAGVDVSHVEQSDRAIVAWHNALTEAAAQGRILGIIQIAQAEYPNHVELADAVATWRTRTSISIHPGEISIRLGQTIQRVDRLEREVRRIWRFVIPPPRRRVSLILCVLVIVVWWTCIVTLWQWYAQNLIQAGGINLGFLLAAGLLFWLSQEDRDDEERT